MVKKKNLSDSIAELLPEGMNSEILSKISDLVSKYTVDKVNEEVKVYMENYARKTRSFIRSQIDKLKEQAVKELELENETFRNAQLFETVRSMFAVEVTGDDEINGANILASVNEAQESKIDVLVNEVNRLLEENVKLRNSAKVVAEKNSLLESSIKKLKDKVSNLVETKTNRNSVMSDSAVVVSESTFKKAGPDKKVKASNKKFANEWLSEQVIDGVRTLIKG
jgi:hypothetical protein